MGASYTKPQLKEGVQTCNGYSMFPIPGVIRKMIFFSIEEAERIKGSPGNVPEISVVFHKNYTAWVSQGYITAFI